MSKLLLGVLATLVCYAALAQKVTDYTIDVHFFPEKAQMWGYPVSNQSFMKGNTQVSFSELNKIDSLTFYLHGELKIDSIISAGKSLKYTSNKVFYEEDYSNVALVTTVDFSNSKESLTIHYSGFMNPSRARSLSDYMRIHKEEGVFLRGYYYSPWFPVFHKLEDDDYEVNFKKVTVRLPKTFNSVVTGELLGENIENETYIAEWKPGKIKTSDIQCAAGEYQVISKDNTYVYYMDDEQSGQKIIDFTQKLRERFSSTLRNVQQTTPLYIVEMPEYGNISAQNMIGISSDLYKKFDTHLYSKLTIAHELVHPYVAIAVSKDNPFAALIKEGFPSFFHLYGLKRISDSANDFDLKKYMNRIEKSYLKKKKSGKDRRGNLLPSEKPILKITFDEIGIYKDVFILSDRARLFLYHLWNEMGDNAYDQFLKELFSQDSINYVVFESLILKYVPEYKDDLHLWLNTNAYPQSLHIK